VQHNLTRREEDVLRSVASGPSNQVVAELLGLSETTIKIHLINIYRKIGVANRTQAAEWARKHGESEGGMGVREPRRPTPTGSSDAKALPMPGSDEDA
jgi:DNA-binding CsgD family transcriptional regulator